jgi:uncharacterized membrane protein
MRILLAGESWVTYQFHLKGRAAFAVGGYGEGASHLVQYARAAGHEIDHLPNELAAESFPREAASLQAYDVVVLSDLPSDSLLLDDQVLSGTPSVDRVHLLAEYVRGGGGLIMVGGYMSFAGHGGQARYGATELADVLPVHIGSADDRSERPAGVHPAVQLAGHPIVQKLPGQWPPVLGYNRVTAKAGADTIVTVGSDPLIVTAQVGQGRAVAYTSDLSPHWASTEFVAWPLLETLWLNLLTWAGGQLVTVSTHRETQDA